MYSTDLFPMLYWMRHVGWKRWAFVVLLIGSVVTSCQPEKNPDERESGRAQDAKTLTDRYWLFARLDDFAGNYVLTVNGFPIEKEPVNIRVTNQEIGARSNTALIGRGNVAEVRVDPYMRQRGESLQIGPVRMEAWVAREAEDDSYVSVHRRENGNEMGIPAAAVDSAYRAWTERARAQWQSYRERTDAPLDSIRAWADRHPMVVSTTFDNEAGPDFSAVFREAPVIRGTPQDTARLVDYAMQLRDLMAAKDTSALVSAFLPLYQDPGKPLHVPDLRSRLPDGRVQQAREEVVLTGLYLDIQRSDVGLRRWSDGRVWEIYYQPDGGPFFAAKTEREGTDEFTGSGIVREIYVAEIGGKLKVVRVG